MDHAPHHRGSYPKLSTAMNMRSRSNPSTRCWRDGLTLAEHPPHRTGKPAKWTCGHVDLDHPAPHTIPGALLIDGRWCAPEVSVCNYSEGALAGNADRRGTTLSGGRYVRIEEPHTETW